MVKQCGSGAQPDNGSGPSLGQCAGLRTVPTELHRLSCSRRSPRLVTSLELPCRKASERRLRNWARARASLDIASQRNIAGRVVPSRAREARANRVMWHRTRSDHKRRAWDRVADGNTPLRCRLMLRKTLGNGGQPGSEALPAENRKNGVQVGRAALSSLDSVARRINMGHFVANRKTRARRA